MSNKNAYEQVEDMQMRRALYELAWERAHPKFGGFPPKPCPRLSDEAIQEELKRILGIKMGLFR